MKTPRTRKKERREERKKIQVIERNEKKATGKDKLYGTRKENPKEQEGEVKRSKGGKATNTTKVSDGRAPGHA